MKKGILGLAILFAINLLFGETIINNGAEISGNWTTADAPYIIEGEAIIPESETLTIEPGVVIKLKTGVQTDYTDPAFDVGFIRINGKISAVGTEEEPIIFTRNGENGNWGSIFFNETTDDSNILKHCEIEYGYQVSNLIGTEGFWGALSLYKSKANIESSDIKDNHGSGIYCHDNSTVTIKENTISGNEVMAILANSSYPTITNNLIEYNSYGIYCYNYSASEISNNTIKDNSNDGIFCDNANPGTVIVNNIVLDNLVGIDCYESSPKIINNVIADNTQDGIYCYTNSSPDITNNTIVNNSETGIFCYQICNPEIVNNIFHGNSQQAYDIVVHPYDENTSHPKVSYSLLETMESELQPEIQIGNGNIFAGTPSFTNGGDQDYTITENSDAIDLGTPNTIGLDLPDFCIDGTARILNERVDIGAYEYNPNSSISDNGAINSYKLVSTNYPNPFNPETVISFSIPQNSNVEISIHNMNGQKVRSLFKGIKPKGTNHVRWNGKNDSGSLTPSGLYIYTIKAAGQTVKGRMTYLK